MPRDDQASTAVKSVWGGGAANAVRPAATAPLPLNSPEAFPAVTAVHRPAAQLNVSPCCRTIVKFLAHPTRHFDCFELLSRLSLRSLLDWTAKTSDVWMTTGLLGCWEWSCPCGRAFAVSGYRPRCSDGSQCSTGCPEAILQHLAGAGAEDRKGDAQEHAVSLEAPASPVAAKSTCTFAANCTCRHCRLEYFGRLCLPSGPVSVCNRPVTTGLLDALRRRAERKREKEAEPSTTSEPSPPVTPHQLPGLVKAPSPAVSPAKSPRAAMEPAAASSPRQPHQSPSTAAKVASPPVALPASQQPLPQLSLDGDIVAHCLQASSCQFKSAAAAFASAASDCFDKLFFWCYTLSTLCAADRGDAQDAAD